jgi:dsRNA-specific ribonuclease
MSCVLGFHKYCLFYDQQDNLFSKKDVRDYLKYSFTQKDFPMNQRKLEPFETPKILGDIFESVMGAIFEDGGLDSVHLVYKHLLSPLILYNSKFSKLSSCYGEPKEQFQWKCHEFKIKPKYLIDEAPKLQCIEGEFESMMYTCNVLYKNGRVMCGSLGSCKRQAERNAAVMGLLWIEAHKDELRVQKSRRVKLPSLEGR